MGDNVYTKKKQKITVRWCEGFYLLYQFLGCMCSQWLGDYGSKCRYLPAVIRRLMGHFFSIFLIKFVKFLINFDFRITQNPCIISMKHFYLSLFFILCMHVLLAYMSVHHLRAWCLQRAEKGIRSPDTGAAASCELSCACWESIMGSLEEQQVLSTTHWASWAWPNHSEHGNDFRAFWTFSIT